MENKINIAELLKDCPKGMELDCILFNKPVKYGGINNDDVYSIIIIVENGEYFYLTKEGYLYNIPNSKCIIFPKGKTTWEGFHRPFKDGDIVTWKDRGSLVSFIYKERKDVAVVKHHFALYTGNLGTVTDGEISLVENEIVFATEEEKQKLFDAIKANGYRWNAETKTLEKLIEPKFKVGDTITNGKISIKIGYIDNEYYYEISRNIANRLFIKNQDEWNLVPNKFDINTLIPFESRVLVRSVDEGLWKPAIYGFSHPNGCYVVGGACWKQCIPYKGNERLIGTINDCAKIYKTWEQD